MSATAKSPSIDVSKLSVEQAVSKLVSYSIMLPASDIFFAEDDSAMTVSVRHLGVVQSITSVPRELGRRFVAHVKALAGMDVAEKRRPQDGRWLFKGDDDQLVDLRVNMVPTTHGEDLALRLLTRNSKLFKIDELGLSKDQFGELLNMLSSPGGLILFTGPTGSGKTASMYASLVHLNDGRKKINTIEDPVEYAIAGVRQSQTNQQIELGFSTMLRNVLRQSPDVIMVGEIRDTETAETAVRAANSGHLVLATIHAPIAAGAVQSMRSLGVHPHFLATSLLGIISQRLVRTLCDQCKMTFDLSMAPNTFDEVRPWLAPGEGNKLFAPKGCPACQSLGYAGRTGVFEIIRINRKLRDLISDSRSTRELRQAAASDKMLDFRQSALLKVAQGVTSTEEVFRVIPSEHLIEEMDV
jgi:type II secretory ATPase GspE/PulE/Tfp pilus assembly ATPase PilB-like protein